MNWLKRLASKHKHEYTYYHKKDYMGISTGRETYYCFVCKECGRTKEISESSIERNSRKISELVSREKAMGIDNSLYKDLIFHIVNFEFRGKNAFYMQKKYENIESRLIARNHL